MNRRRTIVLALGAAAALAAPFSLAQPPGKKWRIGFLSVDSAASGAGRAIRTRLPPFLAALGYREGENLEIQWRWADGKRESLPDLAAGLVRSAVDLIVARNNVSITAAKNATTSIPIVMFSGIDPVENGLVLSLGRPGGNVTGTTYLTSATMAKILQVLKEIAPRVRRVAALVTVGSSDQFYRKSLQSGADKLGLAIRFHEVRSVDEIGGVLEKVAESGADSMLGADNPLIRERSDQVIAFMRERKMASISNVAGFAERGGLAHYAPDGDEFLARVAGYVDRILKGAKPADLPIHQPDKYEFAINLNTAKAIGIQVPQSALLQATKVIE